MDRFAFRSSKIDLIDHHLPSEFWVISYLARTSEACAYVKTGYALDRLDDAGAPSWIRSALVTAAEGMPAGIEIPLSLDTALTLNRVAQAKVLYEQIYLGVPRATTFVRRYQLENRGLSILFSSAPPTPATVNRLGCVALGGGALDELDLAYAPVSAWTAGRKRRYLGASI